VVETGEYRLRGYQGPTITCEKCGADMQLRSGRFGKYFACTGEGCTNTRKLLRSGEAAPPKSPPVPMPELRCSKVDDHFVLRDGASGLFLAASQFPKHRETRAPTIAELKSHRAELDPKHRYLLDAPETDPAGNPAQLRFARKTRSQYVMSEVDGKPTGWRAVYDGARWNEEGEAEAPPAPARKPRTLTKRVVRRRSRNRRATAS
jgi:DNA topoisomerase-1